MESNKLMCPVCGKYEFKEENDFDICPYCGWENDSLYLDNPNEDVGGPNEGSINECRKIYQENLRKDPNYKWKK